MIVNTRRGFSAAAFIYFHITCIYSSTWYILQNNLETQKKKKKKKKKGIFKTWCLTGKCTFDYILIRRKNNWSKKMWFWQMWFYILVNIYEIFDVYMTYLCISFNFYILILLGSLWYTENNCKRNIIFCVWYLLKTA